MANTFLLIWELISVGISFFIVKQLISTWVSSKAPPFDKETKTSQQPLVILSIFLLLFAIIFTAPLFVSGILTWIVNDEIIDSLVILPYAKILTVTLFASVTLISCLYLFIRPRRNAILTDYENQVKSERTKGLPIFWLKLMCMCVLVTVVMLYFGNLLFR
jgi:hypothetical protein